MFARAIEFCPGSSFFLKIFQIVLRKTVWIFKSCILSVFTSPANLIFLRAGPVMQKVEIEKAVSGKIELKGELSYENVMTLSHDASAMFSSKSDLCIDLAGITHTDSAGIALLVEWLSEARHHNQDINFVNVPEQVMEVAKISNLDRVLPMS